PVEDEGVDAVAHPAGVLDPWRGQAARRKEGPVFLPLRPLLDPAPDQLDLLSGQLATGAGGRHALGRALGGDAQGQFGLGRVAGNKRTVPAAVAEGALLRVEAEVCLVFRPLGTVALG